MIVQEFSGKAVGVFGLARSGLSAARVLKAGGARLYAWDDGEAARQAAAKENIPLEPRDRWPWQQIETLVLSPGIPLTHPEPHPVVRQAKAAGAEVIGDVELFARALKASRKEKSAARIIAVTGTNGKSTTTGMVERLLTAHRVKTLAAGHIGTPVCSVVEQTSGLDFLTLEASAFQLESIQFFRPAVGVLLNITPDHMDRYTGMADYAQAKARLFENQQPFDWAIVQSEALAQLRALKVNIPSKIITFSANNRRADLFLVHVLPRLFAVAARRRYGSSGS